MGKGFGVVSIKTDIELAVKTVQDLIADTTNDAEAVAVKSDTVQVGDIWLMKRDLVRVTRLEVDDSSVFVEVLFDWNIERNYLASGLKKAGLLVWRKGVSDV